MEAGVEHCRIRQLFVTDPSETGDCGAAQANTPTLPGYTKTSGFPVSRPLPQSFGEVLEGEKETYPSREARVDKACAVLGETVATYQGEGWAPVSCDQGCPSCRMSAVVAARLPQRTGA